MIKKCKVLSYNKYQNIVVVDFDGIQVQLPCKSFIEDFCYVKNENNNFVLSSEEDFKSLKRKLVRNSKKKAIADNNEKVL